MISSAARCHVRPSVTMHSACTRARSFLRRSFSVLLATVAFCGIAFLPSATRAQDADSEVLKKIQDQLDQLTRKMELKDQRIDTLEREVRQLQDDKRSIPADKEKQRLLGSVESPFLGSSYYGVRGGSFYFAAELSLVNLTPNRIEISRDDIVLKADGERFQYEKQLPSNYRNMSVQSGSTTVMLSSMSMPETVSIEPGHFVKKWVRFINIPRTPTVPRLRLEIATHNFEVNINRAAQQELDLDIQRIGPRGSLAMVSVGGSINPISAGALTDALQEMIDKKVVRAVIRWEDAAPPLSSQARSWITMAANNIGMQTAPNTGSAFPAWPGGLRELHLSALPGMSRPMSSRSYTSSKYPSGRVSRIHSNDAAAVRAALKSVYERLPLDELEADIRNGDKHTRVAAIASGGRLSNEKLPLLLELAEDNDADIQQAALGALGHFGDERAVEKLLKYVRKNVAPFADTAVTGLAASRFPVAHQALLEVLANEPPDSRKRIVQVLANYPRPVWADAIYEYASDQNSGLVSDSLKALAVIGHPKLTELLVQAIESKNATLQTEAFSLLSARKDPVSEKAALAYTMKYMEKKTPTTTMLKLIERAEYKPAIPRLVHYFKTERTNRSNVITTLATIGDQSMMDVFLEAFPRLESQQQIVVLNAISRLRPKEYRRLAAESLKSTNSSLVSSVAQGLINDGSPAAVKILKDTLKTTKRSTTISYVARNLGNLGTLEARRALREALLTATPRSSNERNIAQALTTLQRRSPAYNYWRQGNAKSDDPENAEEQLELYNQAIAADEKFPEAWASRGHVNLHLDKLDQALSDFQRAAELDPYSALGVTGQGIVLVQQAKIEDGIQMVKASQKRFPKDELFAYNAACIYGLAIQAAQKDKDKADSEKKVTEWTESSLDELEKAVKLGFIDRAHIEKDPDLDAIRKDPRYESIIAPLEAAKP